MQKLKLNPTILVTKEIFSKFNDEIDQPNVFNFIFLAVSSRINQEDLRFDKVCFIVGYN